MTSGPAVARLPDDPVAATRRPARGTPRERKRERTAYFAYRFAETVLQWLPRRLLMPLSAAAATGVFAVAGDKRALTRENLSRPLGLSPDDPRVYRAARRAFRNYAKYLVDMMRLGGLSDEDVDDLVHESEQAGQGVIVEARGHADVAARR